MRHFIAPLTLALAIIAGPALIQPTLVAEEKKEEHQHKEGEKHVHADGHKLGEVTLGGTVFTVELEGKLEAGKEVEIKLTAKGPIPAGKIRGWIGIESGKGSVKGHSHKEDDGLCIHAEAPDSIASDAMVWVELEVDGVKTKASVGLPK